MSSVFKDEENFNESELYTKPPQKFTTSEHFKNTIYELPKNSDTQLQIIVWRQATTHYLEAEKDEQKLCFMENTTPNNTLDIMYEINVCQMNKPSSVSAIWCT